MAAIAAGVDVGGTKIEVVLIDAAGVVIARTRRATPHLITEPAGAATASVITEALFELLGDDVSLPVGLGLPGMMTHAGVLAYAPNLPSGNGADFVHLMQTHRPGQRFVCANDADCAAVAEHAAGSARGFNDFLMVTLGTGIGGGLFSGGKLVRGSNGFAGEIGHVVVDPRGPRCPCGNRGCWERFASGAGVARLAREAAIAGRLPHLVGQIGDPELIRGEDVTRAAQEGLPEALVVVDEVGWWLALGIANMAAILDIGRVVIGGGLTQAAALLIPAARKHLDGMVEGGEVRPPIEIVAAHFGEQAGAIGAGFLASQSYPS